MNQISTSPLDCPQRPGSDVDGPARGEGADPSNPDVADAFLGRKSPPVDASPSVGSNNGHLVAAIGETGC
jgi:hypothetical protein